MKVYISADIEGVAGITTTEECDPNKQECSYFQEQMTAEVVAACEGAIAAGAKEILVKDAHWFGRNIDARKLPQCAKIARGWSGHPLCMMEGLDETFDAVAFIGYHARAGSGGNPLAHTMSGGTVAELRINKEPVSEFTINANSAAMLKVPVVFLSGDAALCAAVNKHDDRIQSVATFEGFGRGTVSIHPHLAVSQIRETMKRSLVGKLPSSPALPEHFTVELDCKNPRDAYSKSFYPGATLIGEATVGFESKDYFNVLRFIKFMTFGG
jgi:D-amino peptidase